MQLVMTDRATMENLSNPKFRDDPSFRSTSFLTFPSESFQGLFALVQHTKDFGLLPVGARQARRCLVYVRASSQTQGVARLLVLIPRTSGKYHTKRTSSSRYNQMVVRSVLTIGSVIEPQARDMFRQTSLLNLQNNVDTTHEKRGNALRHSDGMYDHFSLQGRIAWEAALL
jgi:hypothetical protein